MRKFDVLVAFIIVLKNLDRLKENDIEINMIFNNWLVPKKIYGSVIKQNKIIKFA